VEEIGKSLPVVFKRHVRRAGPQLARILAPLWARAAGRAIAEHSRPVAFAAGELTLETTCETWAAQLRQMQAPIAEKVNAFLGEPVVKELKVRVAPDLAAWDAARQLKLHAPGSREPVVPEIDFDGGTDTETTRVLGRSFTKYFSRRKKRLN
jgi:hypothetical protein